MCVLACVHVVGMWTRVCAHFCPYRHVICRGLYRPWDLSTFIIFKCIIFVGIYIHLGCLRPYALYQGQPWLFKRKDKAFNLSAKSSQWSLSLVSVSEKERREEKETPKNLRIGIFHFDVDVRI